MNCPYSHPLHIKTKSKPPKDEWRREAPPFIFWDLEKFGVSVGGKTKLQNRDY
jgi:hypothetical protein